MLDNLINLNIFQGGSEDTVLTFEEDQIQDHTHGLSDPGHSHTSKIRHYAGGTEDCGGSGCSHINEGKEEVSTSSEATGITVTSVNSSYRYGDETRHTPPEG